MTPEQVKQIIREELQELLASDRYIFSKRVQFLDGRHIQFGLTNGTKLGTASTQKLGFFNATPVSQQAAISAPSGGGGSASDAVDQTARTAINNIRAALTALGLTA